MKILSVILFLLFVFLSPYIAYALDQKWHAKGRDITAGLLIVALITMLVIVSS